MIHEPKNMTLALKQSIIKCQRYKNGGGIVSCGHDFWEHAEGKPSGDIFLCTRCAQYFVKANGLPWWTDEGEKGFVHTYHQDPASHHHIENGGWFYPIEIRLQDVNGNTIND